MAGLVPAIHVFADRKEKEDVDARVKPGHDGESSDLLPPHRLRQTRFRRAGPQRLLLAFVRRPADSQITSKVARMRPSGSAKRSA
jgi:hypothetical protein